MSSAARVFLAGLLYFALVFGAGAILGTARVLWLAPALGARTAELLEMPVMLAVTIAAAWWVVRRLRLAAARERLGMGALALAFVLACEFTVVLAARGLTLERYFQTLDPLTGTLYYVLLAVALFVPVWIPPEKGAAA